MNVLVESPMIIVHTRNKVTAVSAVFALVRNLSVQNSTKYLDHRAQRGNYRNFRQAMEQIPDIEPEDFDRLIAITKP